MILPARVPAFSLALDEIATRAATGAWRWSDLESAIALREQGRELPGVVATLRRAVKVFDQTGAPLDGPIDELRRAILTPFSDRAFEDAVANWRGTRLKVGDHEILVALAHPQSDGTGGHVADALCLVVAIAVGTVGEADGLRTIASAARKARTEFVWGQLLSKLPRPEGSFVTWVARLTMLEPRELVLAVPGAPKVASALFLDALISTAHRLGQTRAPRRHSVLQRSLFDPPEIGVEPKPPPDSGDAIAAPVTKVLPHGPRVRSPEGRVRIPVNPPRRAAGSPSNRRHALARSEIDETSPPLFETLEFEPDPTKPEEPPTPLQLLVQAADDLEIVQPEPQTQNAADQGDVFRLMQLGARLPWHWDHLNPHDIANLLAAIDEALRAPGTQPGALIVAVMLCSGALLQHVLLGPAPTGDTFSRTLRGPDRRWRGKGAEGLLESSTEEVSLQWPPAVRQLAEPWLEIRPGARTVGTLLDIPDAETGREVLFKWLGEVRAGSLGVRLTHGRISRHLTVVVRAISGAEWAVHMLAGTPQDVPPISTYYTAVPVADLARIHGVAMTEIFRAPLGDSPQTATVAVSSYAGARVAEEGHIRQWIDHLSSQVLQAASPTGSLVERHNAYAKYVVWLLMAATGHRPVTDPFESIDTFDLDRGICLATDKSWQGPEQARIIPFGPLVRDALSGWMDHLRRLAVALGDVGMSRRIATVLTPRAIRSMPLFFLLRQTKGKTSWFSISSRELEDSLGALGGLTTNFFRRQLATLIARTEIADELTRAVLGHEETGIAPHGRFSTRAPAELQVIGALADDWLRQLGWQALRSPFREFDPAGYQSPPPVIEPVVLGAQMRREAKRRENGETTKDARSLLATWIRHVRGHGINQRRVDELFRDLKRATAKAEQLAAGYELMARANRYVLRFASQFEVGEIKFPERRKAIRPEPAAFSTGDLAEASRMPGLRKAFEKILHGRARSSAVPEFNRVLAEALTSLAIHSLLGDEDLLLGLWRHPDFSLIQVEGLVAQICIEKRIRADDQTPATTRRYPLHPATAALLSRIPRMDPEQLKKRRLGKELRYLSQEMHALIDTDHRPRDTDASVIEWLAAPAATEGRLILPAHVAAYMDGRTTSVSIAHPEWLRFLGGEAGDVAKSFAVDSASSDMLPSEVPDALPPVGDVDTIANEASAKRHAQALHVAVRTVLSKDQPESSRTASPGVHLSRQRRETQALLRVNLATSKGAPDLCRALVQWLIELLDKKELRQSTCSRYYFALALLMRDHAYDLKLDEASEEVLSDTYAQMLGAVPPSGIEMAVGRLREFHGFLVLTHGVVSVDWGDVMPENLPDTFAPDASIILLAHYRRALALLASDPSTDLRERRMQAVLLLLHFRFGLRASEAAALRRIDLVHCPDEPCQWIVLVRPNEHRLIKSDSGIRQVPLLEPLDKFEEQLLSEWAAHAEEQSSSDRLSVLFNDLGRPRRLLDRHRVGLRMVEALRVVSGNPRIRLHHLRHTYATRMTLLLSADVPMKATAREMFERVAGNTVAADVQTVLLGKPGPDGRALWALAGIMGHASPGTTMRWYVHLLDLLAAICLEPAYERCPIALAGFELSYWIGMAALERGGTHRLDTRVLCKLPVERLQRVRLKSLSSKGVVSLPVRKTEQPALLNPVTIDRILDVAFRSGRIDGIAGSVMCTTEDVGRVLDTDLVIRNSAGYDLRKARWAPTEAAAAVSHHRTGSRAGRETVRIRPILHQLPTLLSEPNFLGLTQQICTIWQRRFRASSTPLVLGSREELQLVSEWLCHLGVLYIDIVVTTGAPESAAKVPSSPNSVTTRHASWLENARAQHRVTGRARLGVQVRRNKDGPLSSMAAFHRVMHAMSIWGSIRA